MEETKSCPTKLSRSRQPVKTEWGAHYMVLTYFQGDINSMVDEHFSRALRLTKNPQDLSRKNSSENGVTNNAEDHVPPHPWGLSPQWAKSYNTSPPLNLCASHGNRDAPAMDFYQPSVLQGSPPTTTAELWPRASGSNPSLTAVSVYPASDQQKAESCMSDDKYGSLLGLLEQERCPSSIQEPSDSQSACPTSSSRLQNMSQRYPF